MPPLFSKIKAGQPRFLFAYRSAATIAADPIPTAVPIHTPLPAVFRAADARSDLFSVACSGAPPSGALSLGWVMVNQLMQQGRLRGKMAPAYLRQ
jgi:hypothetical protein